MNTTPQQIEITGTVPRRTQKINGRLYEYEDYPFWDPVKKQGRHKRVYTGSYKDDGTFVPSKKYTKNKAKALTPIEPGKDEQQIVHPAKVYHYGACYLLDEIAQRTGVAEDLQACFPETFKLILSLAYYHIIESGSPLYLASHFTRTHSHPYEKAMYSSQISNLLLTIDEDSKLNFFKKQTKRRLESEYLAYNTTSFSSYSNNIDEAKYGYNKDNDNLKQINLTLIIGEKSLLPVYYRLLPGNISDSKTIKKLIIDSGFLKIDNVKFIMDRGFCSLNNVKSLMSENIPFIIECRKNIFLIERYINESLLLGHNGSNFIAKYALHGYMFEDKTLVQFTNEINRIYEKNIPIFIYIIFDPLKATEKTTNFYINIHNAIQDFYDNTLNKEQNNLISKFCIYHIKNNKKIDIALNNKTIQEHINYFGYYGFLSNQKMELEDLIYQYRQKDVVEKGFCQIKHLISRENTTMEHSLDGVHGHTFIKFVALIFRCAIHKVMEESSSYKDYTMIELIREIDIINKYIYPKTKIHYGEITNKQIDIFNLFNVQQPK
jgi:transposase